MPRLAATAAEVRAFHDRFCLCCYCCQWCERGHGSPCPNGCNAGHLLPFALLPAAVRRYTEGEQ